MAARFANYELRANQGAVGRFDNAKRIFQDEERRCLQEGRFAELDSLRRSQFMQPPTFGASGSAYLNGWGFYMPGRNTRTHPAEVLEALQPPASEAQSQRSARSCRSHASSPSCRGSERHSRPQSVECVDPSEASRDLAKRLRSTSSAPVLMRTDPGPSWSSVPIIRRSAAVVRNRDPGSAKYQMERAADLGGMWVPGGRWNWAGPDLHTRGMWGRPCDVERAHRMVGYWQPAVRHPSWRLHP
eukprot:gnl/TRDRNA2_/TRDRNA2_90557_c0_seq1.p1 gnl/TRDRNA2_/TRDRNA2_90557_c0~~gnl/TRDRNA2_/TRDRNA2_90557_c0_seq1.p1  ORF type:complete len:243 (-),score=14.06 gnl/TRDRNA2_/TRDRNA2_90557_c0_seq1:53-781(-)